MKIIYRTILVVLFLTMGLAGISGTAQADHVDHPTHWGHGWAPLVSAPCSPTNNICAYTGFAEATWYNSHYPNGFVTNQPFMGCGEASGWIKVCWQTQAYINAQVGCSGPADVYACTKVYLTSNEPTVHIEKVQMSICSNCNLTAAQMQNLVMHQYGHALGLGHTSSPNSVMQLNVPPPYNVYPVQHDMDSLAYMYTRMTSSEELCCGQQLRSWDHYYRLIFQPTDGNLVLYGGGANGGNPIWAANSGSQGATYAVLQSDGNFVVRNTTRAICSTHTSGVANELKVEVDGNLVIYNSQAQPIWVKGPCYPA